MTIPVDLFPGASRRDWEALERACEAIEKSGGFPFSKPELGSGIGSQRAARLAIQSLLALDLIERVSPRASRPVYYRVPGGAA